MEKKSTEIKLTKKEIFGFSTGIIPGSLISITYTLCYIEFFQIELGLQASYFILGMIIYLFVNAFNDPLLGQLSDRTNREKWGSRRKVYLKYGTPILALAFISIWIPWSYTNQLIIFLHFVISICCYETMMTLILMCWAVLLPEMTQNIDERNKVNFVCLIFGFFSSIPVMIMPILLRSGSKETGYLPFQITTGIFALITLVCYAIVIKTCDERPEFQKDASFPLTKSVKESLKHKSFLMHVGFNFCQSLNGSMGIPFLFVYVLVLGNDFVMVTIYFYLIFILVGYISSLFCLNYRKKWGMRKLVLRFGILRILGSILIFFLILNPTTEPLIWLGFIWTTFFGGAVTIFLSSFLYLVMDEDEVKHGSRREGMFFGMNALFTKPAESIGPIFATLFLIYIGYNGSFQNFPFPIPQMSSTLLGIKILFLIIPAIINIIGLIFMYFYPLHDDYLEYIQTELNEIHRQKKEKIKDLY